jgi:nucleotide-binding universal stress UspA family protein
MKTSTTFHPAKILCPVDFSELSDLALKYAAAGARAFDATLVVIHAQRFELPAYFTSAQTAELTRQHQMEQKRAKDFLKLHTRRILGPAVGQLRIQFDSADAHPVDAILAACRKQRADLIVMGTHGRGGAKRLWLGSVAENVVRQSEVPVFVVRQKQFGLIDTTQPQESPSIRTILCPVNLTPAAQAALQLATSVAERFGARVVSACVVEPGDKRNLAEAKADLEVWVEKTSKTGCTMENVSRRGHAAEQIVALAQKAKADLVVLGAERRGSAGAWLWGSTTDLVLRQAPVPVLVVPRPASAK